MNINYAYFRNPFLSEMRIFKTINSVREHIQSLSIEQLSIGFVPTMGALHEGHLSLVRRASRENDRVAVSIFVNPIQFNNPADLDKYPRDLAADVELLKPLLKPDDFIFAPSVTEMYPEPETRIFEFGALAEVMEGSSRPGHFNGVGVVVNKLFSIVQPRKSYFGEKDFQQLAIIKRLVEMENLPVKIVPCEIIRESDGLAMSSRNVRLTPEHRRIAPMIYQTLSVAAGRIPASSPEQLRKMITETLNSTGLLRVEYVDFTDESSLRPVHSWADSPDIRCFIAVFAGDVRLIDNIQVSNRDARQS